MMHKVLENLQKKLPNRSIPFVTLVIRFRQRALAICF